MKVPLPVRRDPIRGSRHRLVQRMLVWRRQGKAFDVLLIGVIPEPVLAGLVALDDRMPGLGGVAGRVL